MRNLALFAVVAMVAACGGDLAEGPEGPPGPQGERGGPPMVVDASGRAIGILIDVGPRTFRVYDVDLNATFVVNDSTGFVASEIDTRPLYSGPDCTGEVLYEIECGHRIRLTGLGNDAHGETAPSGVGMLMPDEGGGQSIGLGGSCLNQTYFGCLQSVEAIEFPMTFPPPLGVE